MTPRAPVAPAWLRAVLVAGLALSALGPLAVLLVRSLAGSWFYPELLPGAVDTAAWRSLLTAESRLVAAVATSLLLGLGTGVVACLIALPAGHALARLDGWRRHAGAAAVFLPVAAPPIALATGLQFSFLRLGLGGSVAGVMLAHAVPAAGYAALYFLGVFTLVDPRIADEARALGASPFQVVRHVLVPLLRRPIAEAFVLAFLISWAQVPLTLLIGGGAVRSLPVEVLAFVGAGQDRLAATGALLLVVPALAALAGVGLAARRTDATAL